MKKLISLFILVCFITTGQAGVCPVYAQEFVLPKPGTMVALSPEFNPPILKGLKVHPDNPFRFDFILDQGDSPSLVKEGVRGSLKQEATKLIKYFLASLTIPEKDLWVNLSPYEKNRIVPSLGQTEMGRDLLAEDYMLKQITASLIYPKGETGKKFWKRIYEEAAKKFGTTNIPVNTFNKVWIVPEKAVVYENAKAGTAYVVEAKLKVMLEQDYLALEKNQRQPGDIALAVSPSTLPNELGLNAKATQRNTVNALGSEIVREIVIPELTKEVNSGRNFTQLRQVYNSLILATWYKKKIKDSILEQVYADKNKIQGLVIPGPSNVIPAKGPHAGHSRDAPGIPNKNNVEYIYQQYLKAFKKGVYNYIKEEIDPATQQPIPRKYFSGGFDFAQLGAGDLNRKLIFVTTMDSATVVEDRAGHDEKVEVDLEAMGPEERKIAIQAQADELFNKITNAFEKYTRQGFETFLLRHHIFLEYARSMKEEGDIKIFARRLAEKWNSSDGLKTYGSIFYIVALSIDSYYYDDSKEAVQIHDWLYAFLSVVDTKEQAISLWLVVVANMMHMRALGMHPEWDRGKLPVFHDIEAVFGTDSHEGALPRFMRALYRLEAEGRMDETVRVGDALIQLRDILQWGIALACDPTVHNPRYVLNGFQTNLKALTGSMGPETYMMQSLRKSFGHVLSEPGSRDFIKRSLDVSEKEWEHKGIIPPQRFWAPAYLTLYYVDQGFLHNIFSFLRTGDTTMMEHMKFSKDGVGNSALAELGTLSPVYKTAWSQMEGLLSKNPAMQSTIDKNIIGHAVSIISKKFVLSAFEQGLLAGYFPGALRSRKEAIEQIRALHITGFQETETIGSVITAAWIMAALDLRDDQWALLRQNINRLRLKGADYETIRTSLRIAYELNKEKKINEQGILLVAEYLSGQAVFNEVLSTASVYNMTVIGGYLPANILLVSASIAFEFRLSSSTRRIIEDYLSGKKTYEIAETELKNLEEIKSRDIEIAGVLGEAAFMMERYVFGISASDLTKADARNMVNILDQFYDYMIQGGEYDPESTEAIDRLKGKNFKVDVSINRVSYDKYVDVYYDRKRILSRESSYYSTSATLLPIEASSYGVYLNHNTVAFKTPDGVFFITKEQPWAKYPYKVQHFDFAMQALTAQNNSQAIKFHIDQAMNVRQESKIVIENNLQDDPKLVDLFQRAYNDPVIKDEVIVWIAHFIQVPGIKNIITRLGLFYDERVISGQVQELYHAILLEKEGYRVVAFNLELKNPGTQLRTTEFNIVVRKDDKLFFVEVKQEKVRKDFNFLRYMLDSKDGKDRFDLNKDFFGLIFNAKVKGQLTRQLGRDITAELMKQVKDKKIMPVIFAITYDFPMTVTVTAGFFKFGEHLVAINQKFSVEGDSDGTIKEKLNYLKSTALMVIQRGEKSNFDVSVNYRPKINSFFNNGALPNSAMTTQDMVPHVQRNGGIDLTPANMNLQTQNNGAGIKFHLDPAQLAQLQNAPGFVPVIINIQPMNNLREFLGLDATTHDSPIV